MKIEALDYDDIVQQVDARLDNRTNRSVGCLRQCGLFVIAFLLVRIAIPVADSTQTIDSEIMFFGAIILFPLWLIYILFWHVGAVIIEMLVARYRYRVIHREIERQLWLREGRVPSFVKPRRHQSNEKQKNQVLLANDGEIVSLDDYLDEQEYYQSSS